MIGFDDPGTFRGQLQRGRGVAVRRAPGESGAADVVFECVIVDARWDRQTEVRDGYLAGLIRGLGLSVVPLAERLDAIAGEDPDDILLVLEVLARLLVAGREDAATVLRRYVAGGRHWGAALNAVTFVNSRRVPDGWEDLVDVALACHSDDELQDIVDNGDDSWMRTLLDQRSPRRSWQRVNALYERAGELEQAVASGAEYRNWLRTLADVPRDDLLHQVTSDAARRRWALEELGRRGDTVVLDLVEDPALRNPAGWIPGAPQALEHLGTLAVPRARGWLAGAGAGAGDSPSDVAPSDVAMTELGLRVLATSGDLTDAPVLLSALTGAFDDDDQWCFAEIPAQGLGRLQVAEAAPLLVAAWEQSVHSRARGSFLTALESCAPRSSQVEALADEGLDDCEPTVQQLARTIGSRPRT
ncbi:hypothetical protein GCM10009839_10020 [Catenulispora yoronensis]|uniref:HEAT repeat domain-containing protein n=1 Tax=Catenulispora yoronensis TaxID=450799 RepID=A0ABN2TPW5_9ACTN